MRRWLTLALFLVTVSMAAEPQTLKITQASAQVQDANGDLYVNCSWSVVFAGQSTAPGVAYSPASLLNGQQGTCDSAGNFSVALADNVNQIFPTPSQWSFSICSAPGYVGGTYCRANMLVTITGVTQNLTSTFAALMPVLPQTGAINLAAPPKIGNVTPNQGAFTILSATTSITTPVATVGKLNGACIVDGITNTTLAAAVTCAGTSGIIEITMIPVPALTTDVTIPAGVTLRFDGPSCITTTGHTLTINGPLVAPLVQIFCGSGTVANLSSAYPEWWGNSATCTIGACPLISTAVNSLATTNAGTVYLQNAYYRSGFEELVNIATLTRQGIRIVGARMPQYNGSYSAFIAGTGTIIQGTWWVEADNFQMSDVGIDVGSVFVNALYSATPADAFIMNNNGNTVGKSPKINPVLRNIATLGANAGAGVHSFLLENVTGGYAENIHAVFNTHGFVLKGDHTTVNSVYSLGHNGDCLIVKSDDYAPTHDDSLAGIHCDIVAAGDTNNGILLNPEAADMKNVSISDSTITNVGAAVLLTLNFSSSHITFSNISINGGTHQSVCFKVGGTTVGTNYGVVNLTCNNYDYLIFQTQFLNSSTFSNITGTNIGSGANQGMLLQGVYEMLDNVTMSGTFTTGFNTNCATCVTMLNHWVLPSFAGTPYSATGGAIIKPGLNDNNIVTTGGFNQANPVTVNTTTAVNIGTNFSTQVVVLRDNTNGGSAVIMNDANAGVTIISSVGTTIFVTGAPAATQVQVTNVAGQMQVKGGASRNGAVITVAQLGS